LFQGAKKNGLFKLGTWGTEVHPLLAPQAGDFDVIKHRVSPFYCTDLEAILRAHRVQRIYVAGVSSGGAVLSSAHSADCAGRYCGFWRLYLGADRVGGEMGTVAGGVA
jgi:nicotinamidase-related amidase